MKTNELKLHIRFRFNTLQFIVAEYDGTIFQLPYFDKRTKKLRKIPKVLIGGSIGYRINRKFYSSNKIKSLAYKVDEYIIIGNEENTTF